LHSFRHSFASLHIVDGTSVPYLQEQMGHTDIRLTRTLYGSAFKIRDPGAADRQDARSRLVVTHVVTGTDSGT
jgi:integrase